MAVKHVKGISERWSDVTGKFHAARSSEPFAARTWLIDTCVSPSTGKSSLNGTSVLQQSLNGAAHFCKTELVFTLPRLAVGTGDHSPDPSHSLPSPRPPDVGKDLSSQGAVNGRQGIKSCASSSLPSGCSVLPLEEISLLGNGISAPLDCCLF